MPQSLWPLAVSVTCLLVVAGCVSGERKPLRSAVLLDLRSTKMTEAALGAAIDKYVANSSGAVAEVFSQRPLILNSNGSLLSALVEVEKLLSDEKSFIDVLFLAETADVSVGVSDALKRSGKAHSLTILSAHTSNPKLCDVEANPNTLCLVPRDSVNVRGVLETVSSELAWDSVAVVFGSDAYGTGVESVLDTQVALARSAPTVVAKVFIKASGTADDDDNVIRKVLEYRSAGILCFVGEAGFVRLRSAIARLGKEDELFLLGSHEAVNVLGVLQASPHALGKLWGALFVPRYTSVANLVSHAYFDLQHLDDHGAFVVSHLFDAMQAVALAADTSATAIRLGRFDGFTGTVAFDAITGQREEIVYSLLSKTYTADRPLITWSRNSSASKPVIRNFNPPETKAIISSSPLRAVTVCMAAAPSCSEAESINAMTYVFLHQNNKTSSVKGATTFIPLLLNTGLSGVEGLASLIPVARSCSVLLGPGRSRVALALTPVVNQFAITQLDYNTAEGLFSDRILYPYFSRSTPQNEFNYMTYGEVCAYFGWERVVLVGINDQFGNARVESMQKSMRQRNIHVEQSHMISTTDREHLVGVMDTIYKKDIARVIIVLLPLYGDDAKLFFNLFTELGYMKKYIFFLGNELCQYAASHPDDRNKAQSSFCVFPYVLPRLLEGINTEAAQSGLQKEQVRLLSQGGFAAEVDRCSLTTIRNGDAFAVDAAYTVIDSVNRAVNAGVSLNRSANLIQFVRATSLGGLTGNFTIDKTGNRDVASFGLDIQMLNRTLFLGSWNSRQSPSFRYKATEPIVWMTGSTETPADTFRDIQFILGTTVSASPGAIVLSVLGFVGTVAVFAFCYRHYKLQKLVELSLQSNCVPVTEEEMRRLRGRRSLEPGA
ncbi:putative extracellular receptor [Trypanosoma conorhini]|uniref:Putative extracellular receptor n=1 Tax=Trypanosoma conorhini TaxID=83891 RepID=A0A422Q398_9TRYP|nr:putative extracellular receptor [Trypanosoma conorhini]RNF24444.1 putative extracellular receptor [Trypanosoma conorhini]